MWHSLHRCHWSCPWVEFECDPAGCLGTRCWEKLGGRFQRLRSHRHLQVCPQRGRNPGPGGCCCHRCCSLPTRSPVPVPEPDLALHPAKCGAKLDGVREGRRVTDEHNGQRMQHGRSRQGKKQEASHILPRQTAERGGGRAPSGSEGTRLTGVEK